MADFRTRSLPIPAWNADSVLPPLGSIATDAYRSPYDTTLTDFVDRFGGSDERTAVLGGFLRYRALLHSAGLTVGFQWVDGSFVELIEDTEGRPPRDVDVVTFFRLPTGTTQTEVGAREPRLLDRKYLKETCLVDAYLVDLDQEPARLARRAAYWYSMWGHRRDSLWKGFVQIDLSDTDDATASDLIHGGLP